MNQRFQELARESGYNPEPVGTYEDYVYFSHEKFAEFIIGECIQLAELKGDPKTVLAIKEHFGIE